MTRKERQAENGRLMEQLKTAKGEQRRNIIEILHSRTPSRQQFNHKLRR